MRTTPFDDIDRLFDRMNRRFADFDYGFDEGNRFDGVTHMGGMRMDVVDDGDEILVVADLPGFDKEEITLSVTEKALTISATREQDESDESEAYVRRERSSESVRRTVSLPSMVDSDEASASYKNGVLTVTLPKTEPSEDGHRIDID